MAVIDAPIDKVWSFIAEPANFDQWWDARTRSIVPEGRASPGQTIHAKSGKLNIHVVVDSIDEFKRHIHLTTRLSFGITVSNHIRCTPLYGGVCQVSFG